MAKKTLSGKAAGSAVQAPSADVDRICGLWTEVAHRILERTSGLPLEVEGPSAVAKTRPLRVWTEFAVSGDLAGAITFGIPADSRELPQGFAPFLGTTDGDVSWQEIAAEIAEAWRVALKEQEGMECKLELAKVVGPAGARPRKNFFALLRSGGWVLPLWFAAELVPGLKEEMPASEADGLARGSRDARQGEGADRAASDLAPRDADALFGAREQNLDLLLDIELQASLRFGSREMALHEVLDLNTGDVVPLDRTIHAPVDLVVGDRIVARGQVVLVNGNYGLRVTEVAEPRKRLESIRCLF